MPTSWLSQTAGIPVKSDILDIK